MALIDKITAIADGFRASYGTTDKLSLVEMAELASRGARWTEDIPTTPGQWACLARASQLRDTKYTVRGDLPSYTYATNGTGVLASDGDELQGFWYSSVRGTEWGFIGFAISVYSLLTCLNNPKSFVYTKKYIDYFKAQAENNNVYGTNCSNFVSYCHDLPYLTVTDRLPYLECMCDENGTHNIDGMCWDAEQGAIDTEKLRTELKLCDILNSAEEWGGTGGHAVMVTGIRRDTNGAIQEVDISESTVPLIICTTYSWNEFVSYYVDRMGYRVYRCSKLENVKFPENLTDIVFSDIVTNRGDKISIRPDQDIALNVLGSGYAGIALFRDGVQVSTQASTEDWELTDLSTGKYTAIVYKAGETVTIDDANEHNSTSFIVCNVSISRTDNEFTYTAEAVNGAYPKPMQIAAKNYAGFTLDSLILDIDNFSGSGTSTFEMNDTALSDGVIFHMPFKTEYGFVIAECQCW